MSKSSWWDYFWNGTGVRKVKVTVRDLQRNAARIQEAIQQTRNEIEVISGQMRSIDLTSECGIAEYSHLEAQLKEKHELYAILQKEQAAEYDNIRKLKDGKTVLPVKDAMIIGSLLVVGIFTISLERENPRAIKLAELVLRLFPLRI